MANFLTRVELHGAGELDYTKLHAAMQAKGFARTVTATDGVAYQLPTAEYNCSSTLSASQVCDIAKTAANSTGKTSWIVTVQYSQMSMYLNAAA